MRCLVVHDVPGAAALARSLGYDISPPFLPGWRWRYAPMEPGIRVFTRSEQSALMPSVWDPESDDGNLVSRRLGLALRLALPAPDEAWVALFRMGHLERAVHIGGEDVDRFNAGELHEGTVGVDRMEAFRQGLSWLIGEELQLDPDELVELPEALTRR